MASPEKEDEMIIAYGEILKNSLGIVPEGREEGSLDFMANEKKFKEWAASWDCKENESNNKGYLVGDEIGVGALWEDKSQKDFKSYL